MDGIRNILVYDDDDDGGLHANNYFYIYNVSTNYLCLMCEVGGKR
jgi:hypothetical protein